MKKLLWLGLCVIVGACQVSSIAEKDGQEAEKGTIPVGTVKLETSNFTEYGEYYGKVSGIAENGPDRPWRFPPL